MARQATIVSFDDAKAKSRRGATSRSDSRTKSRSQSRRGSTKRSEDLFEFEMDDRMESGETSRSAKSSRSRRDAETKRDERRRERTKARADKMFSKQFAGSSSDASAEGAPRPALYATKMGSKHRKSARMQRSDSAGSPSAKQNLSGWFSAVPVTPRGIKVATAVLCVILFGAFLYVPAQQYYQAQREHDRLAAEYSTIEDRNEALDVQNDILASDAGMEDAVRQKYGYVKQGEEVAAVTGLSDRATDTSRDSENIEASVLSGSVRAPEEWYTPFLDAFFGVE